VRPGFIRTESDEVQYNLHIMMRFDLERALISGDLAVADLESAWNDRFTRDFGQMVDKPSDGMLQDVHWSVGLFGYFPTYALGNIYAGCLHQDMARDLPDLDADLAQGQLTRATQWLKDKLQRHGARFVPQDTISQAIGGPVDEGALLDYLDDKYTKLYNL
jgi:carboxypeptidase Taq